jgi:hypothetical protein
MYRIYKKEKKVKLKLEIVQEIHRGMK